MDFRYNDGINFPKFKEQKKQFLEGLHEMYDDATSRKKFTGSDIWSFFRDDIQPCIKNR